MTNEDRPTSSAADTPPLPARIHRGVLLALLAVMVIEAALLVYEKLWLNVFVVLAVIAVTLSPAVIGRRLRVDIPAEFQVLVVLFTFSALFLGEVKRYYDVFWWWDIALHASAGLVLGIFGFLLVYVLNEDERVALHMRPRFVALFAFLFAVAVGAMWEVFEFMMDQLFGANMQKPMFGDPSGLTDTMWDLIVDAFGALTISVFGWWYMVHRRQSFIEVWIRRFIERNPRLFRM